ncbi:MAG: hypothetical protein A2Y10_09105 [Planctomycetes bacterium GWF2_41_51]|nr:MAG: hypothetical protein A2Y10_09105 [Planctomycetes bacterium GWF2_41_51]HBG26699.1 sugar phosphate isomerase/epimerase [Phycisphaerales bacterium]
MLKSGLVSVTFRKLDYKAIIEYVKNAGLSAIEWGGDIHVPHGDLQKARQVGAETTAAGIEVAAYGSYYIAGDSSEAGLSFETVLKTAIELASPTIRIWAGKIGSAESDNCYWSKIVTDSKRIAELAAAKKINLSFEFHRNTLADSAQSALRLMQEISNENLKVYWQPSVGMTSNDNLKDLNLLLGYITNVHVFHWNADRSRCLLEDGLKDWKIYFDKLISSGQNHYTMIEFVKDDSIENFIKDSKTLLGLLSKGV